MGKYTKMSQQVLEKVGGLSNITFVERCATRLRIHYASKSKVDVEAIKGIEHVVGVVDKTGQVQIIIGPEVNDAFNDFLEVSGWKPTDDRPTVVEEEPEKKGFMYWVTKFGNFSAAVFMPIVPALITGGLILAIKNLLVNYLGMSTDIRPAYRKLPLILGGEQSVSADEPVRSINQYMDEMEKDPRILSASWHVGYIRHDTDVAGCGVVVVPNSEADQDYAEQKVDELAAYVWERRHEFHYTGLTQEPEEAIQSALNCPGKPVFLTDSGDNTTSGSVGANTWVLRQVMALPDTKGKNFLFGCITDPAVVAQLADVPEGTKTHIRLGMDLDELSRPVELDVTVKHKGRLEGFMGYEGDYGACVLVSVEGYPIDIIVAEASHAVVELHQFEAAGAHCADYGVVIVKQGYIFPELKELGALCVMSLTDGATLQDTRRLPFKRIMRPMFPVDDI